MKCRFELSMVVVVGWRGWDDEPYRTDLDYCIIVVVVAVVALEGETCDDKAKDRWTTSFVYVFIGSCK
jgi:hypothetical protein